MFNAGLVQGGLSDTLLSETKIHRVEEKRRARVSKVSLMRMDDDSERREGRLMEAGISSIEESIHEVEVLKYGWICLKEIEK